MPSPIDHKRENSKETLDSHISFMYNVAKIHSTVSGQAAMISVMTTRSDEDDTRDDIEDRSSGSFEWDEGVTERRDHRVNKDKSKIHKQTNLRCIHNIGKALKKPWKKAKKNSDKVPLISRQNVLDWDTISTYTTNDSIDESISQLQTNTRDV